MVAFSISLQLRLKGMVGNNSLIGMGATVLNRASIGENCLIGANSLIPEGKIIPAGSLVMGIGKVVRKLSEIEIAGIMGSAHHYVENACRFRDGMRPKL